MADDKEVDMLLQNAYKTKPLNTVYAQFVRVATSRNSVYLDFFQSGPNLENLDEDAAFHVQRVVLPSDMLRTVAEGLLDTASGWETDHGIQLPSKGDKNE